jgi:hypothetical protein
MIFVPILFELGVIFGCTLEFWAFAFIKMWFERGLLMLPKKAMAVPMSEPAPPPKTCTSLALSRSASPKWISNLALGGILKAIQTCGLIW